MNRSPVGKYNGILSICKDNFEQDGEKTSLGASRKNELSLIQADYELNSTYKENSTMDM